MVWYDNSVQDATLLYLKVIFLQKRDKSHVVNSLGTGIFFTLKDAA